MTGEAPVLSLDGGIVKNVFQQGRSERICEAYPSHPPRAVSTALPQAVRRACERRENEARWKVRLGAPGLGGWNQTVFHDPAR